MQSPSFVSPLIARTIIAGKPIKGFSLVELVLHLPFSDKKGIFKVDQRFLDEFGGCSEVFDESLAFEIYSELKPICSECLRVAMEKVK